METSRVLLGLACFFDLNKVYLPTYLLYDIFTGPLRYLYYSFTISLLAL